jgi:hypothetical protein
MPDPSPFGAEIERLLSRIEGDVNNPAVERLRDRARGARTRAEIRAWNYRQRNLAVGVWFRVRRALARARAVYAITDEDARQLIAEGFEPETSG